MSLRTVSNSSFVLYGADSLWKVDSFSYGVALGIVLGTVSYLSTRWINHYCPGHEPPP